MSISGKTLYHEDFAEWSAHTAQLLRAGQYDQLDIENLAEEIEDLGKSERSAVRSHLNRLLLHKIKQIIQPERDCASWQVSIVSAQQAILEGIEASPSLRSYLIQNLQKIHQNAMELALIETGLEHAAVPKECPWDLDTLLTR